MATPDVLGPNMVKVLLCVAKCKQRLGRGMTSDVLRGHNSVRVINRRLYLISSFGIMKHHTEEEIEALIDQAIDEELLVETEGEHPLLTLTDKAIELLHEHVGELPEIVREE